MKKGTSSSVFRKEKRAISKFFVAYFYPTFGDASKSGQGEMGEGRRVSLYELSGLFPFLARVHSSTIY